MSETKKTKKPSQTNTRKPGRPKKSPEPQYDEGAEVIRAEVFIISSFVVAVLLFLSNFNLCGAVGQVLKSAQLGLFGSVGYLVPIFLFIGTCFALSNRGNVRATLKLCAAVGAALILCGFFQLLFGGKETGEIGFLQYYQLSAATGKGGGLAGGLLAGGLTSVIGKAGAYVVLIALLIICVVCITEKSVVKAMKNGGDKAYHYAKEDIDRRREIHAERQEERRIRREQRVSGVDLNATKIDDPADAPLCTDAPIRSMFDPVPEPPSLEEMLKRAEEDKKLESRQTKWKEEQQEINQEEEAEPKQEKPNPVFSSADVFTGKIAYSEEKTVSQEELDIPPFEEDGLETGNGSLSFVAPKNTSTLTEMDLLQETGDEYRLDKENHGINYEGEFDALPVKEEVPSSIIMDEEETPLMDSVFVPEGEKRVVTATGKVIESETELLQKKLEKRREEVKEEGSSQAAVAMEAKEKIEEVHKEYIFPPTSLLKKGNKNTAFSEQEYKDTAIKLQQTLRDFGVGVTVTNISCGPSVTRYELHPEQGVKVSKIVALADDIKLSLAAADIRIEAPIPGKSAVGIEVPNKENNIVYLRDLFESEEFKNHSSRLAFAVGKDIGGQTVVTDIAKMPHLLIAGATGSGKSVCINTLIMSIIYKANPDDVKLIMVDPKVVELSVYNGIPHLLIPVVTDPKKASGALNWAVAEMTDRYKKFAEYGVRDLKGYNARVENIQDIEDDKKPKKMPQIVIIVDELADLMMVSPGEVEDSICRLAQLARAAGIHLVIATQRPSVNVITGLIKANVPSRIAFAVSSGVDSRTIIDMNGAEKLLGKGDMLFYPSGMPKPQRVQGAFVSDSEVAQVVEFLSKQELGTPYSPDVEQQIAKGPQGGAGGGDSRDEYFAQAAKFIIEKDKASIGMLQRVFKIGFNRAARIMDQLAEAGVVGEEEGTKPRKVLMSMEQFEELMELGG
ncbi:MAG: DNA translocase FtsK 4TM domain-containing protein [Lachnospiraceae bacterium]